VSEQKKSWVSRHKVLTVIGVVVVLAIIGTAVGGDKNQTASNTNNDTGTNAQSNSSEAEKTEFNVGETATFDGKSITISNVQRNYDTGNQFARPEAGKEFVLVTVDIANNGSGTLDYNTYEFKLQDSNGVQQSESFTALSEGKLNSGSLAAGGKVSGKLAYEVPKDDAGLKLIYQSMSFFSNKTITFNLK
jgi:hypothetical protein